MSFFCLGKIKADKLCKWPDLCISSVMIDREATQHLVSYVKQALQHGEILTELGLEPTEAAERGLRLLYVVSFVFPSHFQYP